MQNSISIGRKGKGGAKFICDKAFMKAVVREYGASDLSLAQLATKYGLKVPRIHKWIAKFSSELEEQRPLPTMTPEQQNELDSLKKQNEELLKRLELANLKITALEIMIDIAEQDYKLDIRKKPGTKQSDD